jgi:hypothetical protein
MLKHFNDFFKGLLILVNRMEAIADPVCRKYLEKIKDTGNPFFTKDVGPGHEDFLAPVAVEGGKRIHQGVLVVDDKNDRLVSRDFFPVYHFKSAVIKPVKDGGKEVKQLIAWGEAFYIIPGHKSDLGVKLSNFQIPSASWRTKQIQNHILMIA